MMKLTVPFKDTPFLCFSYQIDVLLEIVQSFVAPYLWVLARVLVDLVEALVALKYTTAHYQQQKSNKTLLLLEEDTAYECFFWTRNS